MRILAIRDDFYHHADVVDAGLTFLGYEFAVDFVTQARAEQLPDYGAVVLCKDNHVSRHDTSGWITPEFVSALRSYVENGGGLVALHAGTVHCGFNAELKDLVGSAFVRHPEQCPVTVKPVKDNALTKNVKPFTQTDEHYVLDVTAADADVFLESVSEHGTLVAGYSREVGAGRVVTLTPGHSLAVFLEPSCRALIDNAIKYVSRF